MKIWPYELVGSTNEFPGSTENRSCALTNQIECDLKLPGSKIMFLLLTIVQDKSACAVRYYTRGMREVGGGCTITLSSSCCSEYLQREKE